MSTDCSIREDATFRESRSWHMPTAASEACRKDCVGCSSSRILRLSPRSSIFGSPPRGGGTLLAFNLAVPRLERQFARNTESAVANIRRCTSLDCVDGSCAASWSATGRVSREANSSCTRRNWLEFIMTVPCTWPPACSMQGLPMRQAGPREDDGAVNQVCWHDSVGNSLLGVIYG